MNPYGLVLTYGSETLDCRGPHVESFDWFGLLGAPPRRGQNRTVPQQDGAAVRVRYRGELRTPVALRIDGAYNPDGTGHAGSWLEHAHGTLADVLDFLDRTDDGYTATVHRPGSLPTLSGRLQVEDPGVPIPEAGRFVRLVVDVTCPDGRLTVAGS
jgi:hypothetical protein